MRIAKVLVNKQLAGQLIEKDERRGYVFEYTDHYQGSPISLTMPISIKKYEFEKFPAFFDGLLPEGPQLENLLRLKKLDREDYFGQLLTVGEDCVGAVSVEEERQ